jgi:retron-type reverse transcriptase
LKISETRFLGENGFLKDLMPQTFKHLYPQVHAFDNLYHAFRAARQNGKRQKANVAAFEHHLELELTRLETELAEKTYRPGPYHHFYIYERKRRKISAAPFRDRVVHHALCRVIEPIFEARFIHDSYACRVGKGTHRAIERAQELARRYRYALQCDVAQFFPSIDHAILRGLLARYLADEDALWLIDQILASGVGVLADEYEMRYFPGDDLFAVNRPRGLPIGNLTSQFWANVYLNELDYFVKHQLHCPAYVRYADDFLLFSDDKRVLHTWRQELITFLQTLRLQLHAERAAVFPTCDGLTFLGFRLFHYHRRLRNDNARAFSRRLRTMAAAYTAGETTLEKIGERVQSWIAHARFGNTYRLRTQILGSVRLEAPHG